jgi:hypothetical protein
MKKSLGYLLIACASLFTLNTFAQSYSGKGTWRNTNNATGEYNVEINVTPSEENLVSIAQTLTFSDHTLAYNVNIQRIDDHFFNILDENNEQIGTGYCFTLEAPENKICHSETETEEYYVESSLKFYDGQIYRFGSKTDYQSNEKLIWKDHLLPVENNE